MILTSSDNCSFEIPAEAANASEFLANALPDDDDAEDSTDDAVADPCSSPPSVLVELDRVDGVTLEQICDFLKHHLEDPMPEIHSPLISNDFEEVCTTRTMGVALWAQCPSTARNA